MGGTNGARMDCLSGQLSIHRSFAQYKLGLWVWRYLPHLGIRANACGLANAHRALGFLFARASRAAEVFRKTLSIAVLER